MSAKKTGRASYYYANGHRVPLKVDREHVAVDLTAPALAGTEAADRLGPNVTKLPGSNLAIVARKLLPKPVLAALESSGALHPVYQASGARLVAYPEVRVDVSDAERKDVLSVIKGSGIATELGTSEGGEMTVRPRSRRGSDALSLANLISERAHPASAQARFIRVVPRPNPT
jgi:hypothetical protein